MVSICGAGADAGAALAGLIMFSGVSGTDCEDEPPKSCEAGGVGAGPRVNDSDPSMPGTAMEESTPALRTTASPAICAAVAALMGEDDEVPAALPLLDTGPAGPDAPLFPLWPVDPVCDGAGPGVALPPPPVLVDVGPEE